MTAAQVARKARAGILWTAGTSLITRGIGLLTTLMLMGAMDPSEAGAVGMAVTLVMTMTVSSTVGLGQYIASQRDPSPRAAWNGMLLHLALGLLAFAVTLLFRERLARLFGATAGAQYVLPLILIFTLERLGYVPERVLVAHMRFRQLSIMRSAGELGYCGGTLLGVLLGLGPWSIVAGNLVRQLLRVGLIFHYTPPGEWFVPEGPDREMLHELLRFGLPITVGAIAGFGVKYWDNLLIGHYYGADVYGLYSYAYNLALLPAIQIAEMVAEVMAPSFARLDGDERRKAAVDMVGALALCIAPMAVGLALVASTLAPILAWKRPEWVGIAPYLAALSMLSMTRLVGLVLGPYMQALRRTLSAAVMPLTMLALLVVSLVLTGTLMPDTPVAACYAVGATSVVGAGLSVYLLKRLDNISAWKLIWAHLRPVPALVTMAACVLGLDALLFRTGLTPRPVVLLGLEVLAGGIGYIGGAIVFLPGPTRTVLRMVRPSTRLRQAQARSGCADDQATGR